VRKRRLSVGRAREGIVRGCERHGIFEEGEG